MPKESPFWTRVLEPFRAGDWQECIRLTRPVVDNDPFALTPRHLLAGLHERAENPRLARIQYEKLLPLAVGRGDLLRALAVQRHLDRLAGDDQADGRYQAMQRWFRLVGRSLGIPSGPEATGGLTAAALLALPEDALERLALSLRIESLGFDPHAAAIPGGIVCAVLFGTIRWHLEHSGGRRDDPQIASEGQVIRVGANPGQESTFHIEPLLPTECILLRELGELMFSTNDLLTTGEIVHDQRATLPARPRRPEDLDQHPTAPIAEGDAPRRLTLSGEPTRAPADAFIEISNWMDAMEIDLPTDVGDSSAPTETKDEPRPTERTIELDDATKTRDDRRRGRPVVESPRPIELGQGLVVPAMRDPFAEPAGLIGTPIERRRELRVAMDLDGRVRLLGLGAEGRTLEGRVSDLSPSGLALRFDAGSGSAALYPLEDAAIVVELPLPPGGDVHRFAGRVRSFESSEDGSGVRIGVELMLLTDADREVLAQAIRRAEPPRAA